MSDFSQSPLDLLLANRQKGYVGVHIEQGVPILDRDLNLLQDLVTAAVRSVVTRYIGNGLPTGDDGFAIQALPAAQAVQNFGIGAGTAGPGTFLAGGIEVSIPAPATYTGQPGVPVLKTPTAAEPDPRTDAVYLDVSLVEVDGTVDPDLTNSQDVGMQTSVRLKPSWVVRVAEGTPVPAAPSGHVFCPLAQLLRRRGQDTVDASMIKDLRRRRLTVSDLEQRLSLMEKVLLLPAFVPLPQAQFTPKIGGINQLVTLNGTNFSVGPVTVLFGSVPAKISGAPSATQIATRVPPGLTPAGTPVAVKVTVVTGGGAVVSDNTFSVQPTPAFVDPPGQFGPGNGTAGSQVTLNGYNFNVANPQVLFGTVQAPIVGTPTATQIVTQVPTGLVPAGSTSADVKIAVSTAAGSVISDDTFRAELGVPAPTFAAPPNPQFTPKIGSAGQNVQLNGQNFNFLPVSVKFDTVSATVGSSSATQIAVQVPAGVTPPGTSKTVKVSVTTAGGSVTSSDSFSVQG
jgi:hypothetical protein